MKYKCPNCQADLEWDTNNPNRPFCSESCKNTDFIAWANEKNRLPDNENLEVSDNFD